MGTSGSATRSSSASRASSPRSDRDTHDDEPGVLHAVALVGGRAVGAVRLYPGPDAVTWSGDRLAILPEFRGRGMLGARLVRFAVVTARGRGGQRMTAMIQPLNVPFFASLGWRDGGWAGRVSRSGAPAHVDHADEMPVAVSGSRARSQTSRRTAPSLRTSDRPVRELAAVRAGDRLGPQTRR